VHTKPALWKRVAEEEAMSYTQIIVAAGSQSLAEAAMNAEVCRTTFLYKFLPLW